jgi:hypothetical protein
MRKAVWTAAQQVDIPKHHLMRHDEDETGAPFLRAAQRSEEHEASYRVLHVNPGANRRHTGPESD